MTYRKFWMLHICSSHHQARTNCFSAEAGQTKASLMASLEGGENFPTNPLLLSKSQSGATHCVFSMGVGHCYIPFCRSGHVRHSIPQGLSEAPSAICGTVGCICLYSSVPLRSTAVCLWLLGQIQSQVKKKVKFPSAAWCSIAYD